MLTLKLTYKKINHSYNILSLNVIRRKYETVLGIECTCDDTAVAIVDTNRTILAESHRNQWIAHKSSGFAPKYNYRCFGGIIPNLAARLHNNYLLDCVSECIEKLNNGWGSIDTIALSIKPGLEICLWQGIKFTKLLLNKYKKKFVPIHHMESHALTARLFESNLKFPYLSLLISGGHTLIVLVKDCETFYRFGETSDIAIGNCFDKIARRLGLYNSNLANNLSGGALIEKFAQNGDQKRFPHLKTCMKNFCGVNKNCNFSFGGLYTATVQLINNLEKKKLLNDQIISDICASFQAALSLQLENRLERALLYYNNKIKTDNDSINVVIAGGAASNKYIFQNLKKICLNYSNNLIVPPAKYCTDNGVMIAWDACEKILINSKRIIHPNEQTNEFLSNLKPISRCKLGIDISSNINMSNLKIKTFV